MLPGLTTQELSAAACSPFPPAHAAAAIANAAVATSEPLGNGPPQFQVIAPSFPNAITTPSECRSCCRFRILIRKAVPRLPFPFPPTCCAPAPGDPSAGTQGTRESPSLPPDPPSSAGRTTLPAGPLRRTGSPIAAPPSRPSLGLSACAPSPALR